MDEHLKRDVHKGEKHRSDQEYNVLVKSEAEQIILDQSPIEYLLNGGNVEKIIQLLFQQFTEWKITEDPFNDESSRHYDKRNDEV